MLDVKITELPVATLVNPSDVLPIVQSGTTKQAAASLLPGSIPITLNPGDVLAQDADGNELIEFGEDGARSSDYVPITDNLTGYWSVRNHTDPENEADVVVVSEDGNISMLCLDGIALSPSGTNFSIQAGNAFDDGEETPQNGGDVNISVGNGVNGGRDGMVSVSGFVSIQAKDFPIVGAPIKLAPQSDAPDTPEEGMVYAGVDHHLYYYNGTTWKQLDN